MNFVKKHPEYFLLASSLFYWFSSTLINPIAFGLLFLITVLIVSKSKLLANILGFSIGLISIYLILALFSEFKEFPQINSSAIQLLSVGSIFITFNLLLSYGLITKYNTTTPQSYQNT